MRTRIATICLLVTLSAGFAFGQGERWITEYTVLDDFIHGPGLQTASVAAQGANRFVALVTETPNDITIPDSLFSVPGNYLVAYWNADSINGRIPSPIDGSQQQPRYNFSGQFTDWANGLDQVTLDGAWALASGGPDSLIYLANNDDDHNILVFQLNSTELVAAPYRMITGSEYIFALEVDTAGYVYVADYEGTDSKTDEVKVYAGIGFPGTTWDQFGGGSDTPVATIDLPVGTYQGLTVNDDGTEIYVGSSSDRRIWKFVGDPVNGYTQDTGFQVELAPEDTLVSGSRSTILGLAYMSEPASVIAAVDSFLAIGGTSGYTYGRFYRYAPEGGAPLDTADIAAWNFERTGDYSTGSSNGRAGGFTSVVDVDVAPGEQAVYTQTYYGWAVEKWIFDGTLVGVEPIDEAVPVGFDLRQNYPNPFNPETTIEFALRNGAFVTLEVYNVLGQKVATLVNDQLAAGSYRTVFNGATLPSGIYIYKLKAGDYQSVKKMILAR